MKLHGMSQDAIANQLNESGILPPAEYKTSMGSNYQTGFKVKEKSGWSSVAVRRILTNEIYIGNLVQGRQTTPNHKVKQAYLKEESDWVRIEKSHEPVVSDRDFEVVQRLLAMDTRTAPGNGEVYPLSGLVACGGCGMPMIRKTTKAGGKVYSYYICATNKATKECRPPQHVNGKTGTCRAATVTETHRKCYGFTEDSCFYRYGSVPADGYKETGRKESGKAGRGGTVYGFEGDAL